MPCYAVVLNLLTAMVCVAARGQLDCAAVTFGLEMPVFVMPRFTMAAALVTFWLALSGGAALFVQQYGQQRRMPVPGSAPTTQAHGPLKNP